MAKLHVLPNPSGITNVNYRIEPFGVILAKFIKEMTSRNYEIIHYGHQSSDVECDHVDIILNDEMPPPDHSSLLPYDKQIVDLFNQRASEQLATRVDKNDLVLCFYGTDNKPAVDKLPHTIKVVEPSIGYRLDCVFARYRAFTSYSQMHYFYGMHGMLTQPSWYDEVIPNAITPEEFTFNNKPDDYFVYLGRISRDKGIDLAIQATARTGHKLVIAGPGDLRSLGYDELPNNVEHIGYVDRDQRNKVLSNAKGLLALTHYLEPFGNIVAEAAMCGTPSITTDWGGFVDNVDHGRTGFRCKDFKSVVDAINNISTIDRTDCLIWGDSNFSDKVVHDKFDQWLQKIIKEDFYYV